MGNHEAAGVSSERRRSSCSSLAQNPMGQLSLNIFATVLPICKAACTVMSPCITSPATMFSNLPSGCVRIQWIYAQCKGLLYAATAPAICINFACCCFLFATFGLRVLSLPACVCVCVCVCLSVNHELVRAITHQPFKLESPNLAHRCKRSLLFGGRLNLKFKVKWNLKVKIYPILNMSVR